MLSGRLKLFFYFSFDTYNEDFSPANDRHKNWFELLSTPTIDDDIDAATDDHEVSAEDITGNLPFWRHVVACFFMTVSYDFISDKI